MCKVFYHSQSKMSSVLNGKINPIFIDTVQDGAKSTKMSEIS